jgi:Fusaric acid resistance protein-like
MVNLARLHPRPALARARGRVRAILRPVLQTAAAAVGAWYLALLLLPDPRPAFASIAAVVALGASYGQRGSRAVQLAGGVAVGITVADLIVQVIGVGGLQIGVMVLLAMTAARALGGGELLVSEAAVSAILLVTLAPHAGDGFSPNRALEAVIGGGIALAASSILFPPDPVLEAGRAAQSIFAGLARALERVATGLESRDPAAAEAGLREARALDPLVREFDAALERGAETLRLAPPRRAAREAFARYERSRDQLDLAVRDVRVLARHAVRSLRAGDPASPELPSAVRELVLAVWELAGAYDNPSRVGSAREHAIAAAVLAAHPGESTLDTAQVFGQLRSTAVDLRRAADAVGDSTVADELPTEELLAA